MGPGVHRRVKAGTTHLKTPDSCTQAERREFARLVLQGFDAVAETLDGRIRVARCLAFHYTSDGTLAATAALKVPDEEHRRPGRSGSAVSATTGRRIEPT